MNIPWVFRGGAAAAVGAITAVEFDPELELLWVCDSFGNLMSFTVQPHNETTEWAVYSSFSASTRSPSSIGFIPIAGECMVTVPDREVIRGFKRGGVPIMCLPLPSDTQNYIDLFQANTHTGSMYFVGDVGLTRLVLQEGETKRHTVPVEEPTIVALKQFDQWVVTGSTSGTINVFDANDLSSVGSVSPSRNRVMTLDVMGNTIAAAFVERSGTGFVKVFDVRKLGEEVYMIKDIFPGNTTQMRLYLDSFRPTQTRAFLLTPQGYHIIQLDLEKPVYSSGGIIEGSSTAVSVSRNRMCAVVGNDKGHFFALSHPAKRDEYIMSNFIQPVKPKQPSFTQCWVSPNGDNGFDESCASLGLASNWPEDDYMILKVPQKLRCVNLGPYASHSIVPNQWGFIRADSYLIDTKEKLSAIIPNPYPFNTQLGNDPGRVQELLLEFRKDMKRKHKVSRGGGTGEYDPMEDSLQVCYSMQHKLDWRSYNEIPHHVAGMDNSFPESWLTPILQSLYLCQPPEFPIRRVILRHLCRREFCMTCEIAIIFANIMITASSASGLKEAALPPIVQVGNLIRTLRQIRTFATSNVFQKAKNRDDAVAKMHLVQRLILETLHKDLQDQKGYPFMKYQPPSPEYENSIASFFGTEFTVNGRIHVEPRFFWEVPASALKVDEGLQHLLKQLEACKDQVQIKRLPPIIVLLLNPEHNNLKPPTSLKISRSNKEDYNYVLNSNIIHLADDIEDVGNFVSHQRIKDDLFALVNDYRVTSPMKITELEHLIPALRSYSAVVIYYALDQLTAPPYAHQDNNLPPNMWPILGPLLVEDVLAKGLQRNPARQQFKSPLSSHTDIQPGDLVAIDAEYVVLKWPHKDEEADFVYSAHRKPRMGLARVSCVLSREDGDERTIVDDYVHILEEIDDYVTQFSGIHPGDLDPLQSTKNLTSFKSTCLKLRALADAGVVFVGHGLSQDFRVCNIAIPKKQIIDTLELFHVKGGRFLSLRFLMFHILGERVQEGEHDSIEDARASLRLYRKYVQLQKEGTFENALNKIMAKGAETSWFVPESRSGAFNDISESMTGSMISSTVYVSRGANVSDGETTKEILEDVSHLAKEESEVEVEVEGTSKSEGKTIKTGAGSTSSIPATETTS
ncbi:unnamed protein product [Phytomonas sp. Hart1]|nr:unnamed protein product [Phytomonas sp. Hart1]|eukprot:CCW67939.1 unnamed protein product [Phytomonas sp. isolate Hart1]